MKKLKLLLLLAMCLLLAGCAMGRRTPDAAPTQAPAETTAIPAEESASPDAAPTQASAETKAIPAEESASPEEVGPAKAYLLVTVAGTVYEPIPLYEAGRYTIRRGEYVNVIEVTEDSVRMAESTCANQDCVEQGLVTLDNRADRVLRNMIICLPNDVGVELYTYEEILEVVAGYAGGQAE